MSFSGAIMDRLFSTFGQSQANCYFLFPVFDLSSAAVASHLLHRNESGINLIIKEKNDFQHEEKQEKQLAWYIFLFNLYKK